MGIRSISALTISASRARKSIVAFFFALGACTAAQADEWGCQVLLCLSNPNGPMAVAECVPPISRLFHHLAKGGGMPTCEQSGSSRAWAQGASKGWCPQGYLLPHPDIKDEYFCAMAGSIDVEIDGQPWQRIWWGMLSGPGGRNSETLQEQVHFNVPLRKQQ